MRHVIKHSLNSLHSLLQDSLADSDGSRWDPVGIVFHTASMQSFSAVFVAFSRFFSSIYRVFHGYSHSLAFSGSVGLGCFDGRLEGCLEG